MSPSNADPRGVFAHGPPANATQSCLPAPVAVPS